MPIYMSYSGITGDVQNISGLPGQWIEIDSFQFGTNVLPSGPRHTLTLNHAVITDIKPHYPQRRGDKLTMYEKLTITFGYAI
jgi:hypothetical protein